MKVSVELMKWYSGEEQWQLPLDELVTRIGRQLGAVEETVDLAPKYVGAVIVRIVSCVPHPNSDHLHVCKVDDGGKVEGVQRDQDGLVQVVCGAPNVREGLLVVWLPPGATVPETYGREPFVLSAREFRGEMSNGMLASARELDISDDHEGILEITDDHAPGTSFAEAYKLNDAIIDIENKMFTHRPDGFGNLGVAREIAGIQNIPFTSPDWYTHDAKLPEAENDDLPLVVKNELPKLVPRFVAVPIAGVTIGPSPLWMQLVLRNLGIRPINNIVDITNYYMVLTGQPLHAYDYDKVKELSGGKHAELIVRRPNKGEKITMLNGKDLEPYDQAMMVASGDTLVGVGGMIGGANSEVSPHTKNIILEGATWDMYTIRRTSMHHGIFTDAVTRFSKGQSPLQNTAVVAKAAAEIVVLAGGKVAGKAVDINHVDPAALARGSVYAPITTTSDFINTRLGTHLTAENMAVTLNNVEIAVETHGNELTITPPFWRTDIEIPEDIVEEVGRLLGYDQLPHELPNRTTQAVAIQPMDELKAHVRSLLSAAGANELQTYSFVPEKLMTDVGQDPKHAFSIRNALSPELQRYRMSLTPSLLEKVHANIKAGYKEFALFEMNKVHIKGEQFLECDGLPREYQVVAFVFASDNPHPGAAYYHAKKYLDYLLAELNVPANVQPASEVAFEIGRQIFAPYEPKRTGFVYTGENFAGFVGEYKGLVAKKLKLPKVVAGFEIDLERLLQHQKGQQYQPLLKFPATEQDVCFRVSADKAYTEVESLVREALGGEERLRVTIAPLDIYQRADNTSHKQITFRITLQHSDRTLTTDEVNTMLDAVVQHVGAAIGAERV